MEEETFAHEPDLSRFSLRLEGVDNLALLEYQVSEESDGTVYNLVHTYVPPDMRGRGIATRLIKHACAFARENNYKIIPTCSYVPVYLAKNPADMDVVKTN